MYSYWIKDNSSGMKYKIIDAPEDVLHKFFVGTKFIYDPTAPHCTLETCREQVQITLNLRAQGLF